MAEEVTDAGRASRKDCQLARGFGAFFLLLVVLFWLAGVVVNLEWIVDSSFDDDCYSARPVAAVVQAVVASIGLVLAVRGGLGLINANTKWLAHVGASLGILVVWSVLALPLSGALWAHAKPVLCPGQSPHTI